MIHLDIRNLSSVKRLYRQNDLFLLTETICKGEGVDRAVELSVLMCEDPFIQELNQTYRGKNEPTDVLSFQQEGVDAGDLRVLGDIVISLETVARFCGGDRDAMRREVRLLFCHGLLHLLGFTHGNKKDRALMQQKQAAYLNIGLDNSWHK